MHKTLITVGRLIILKECPVTISDDCDDVSRNEVVH